MFKPGKKFIIEIETVYEALPEHSAVEVPKHINHMYRIKGFNSLIMDQWGLRKLDPYRDMKGPYGIGCVMRKPIPHVKPKNRKEMMEWNETGTDPNAVKNTNPAWMITHVDMNEDGTWTYTGMTNTGEEIKVPSTETIYYTGLFFNTVIEWSKYDGEIA